MDRFLPVGFNSFTLIALAANQLALVVCVCVGLGKDYADFYDRRRHYNSLLGSRSLTEGNCLDF